MFVAPSKYIKMAGSVSDLRAINEAVHREPCQHRGHEGCGKGRADGEIAIAGPGQRPAIPQPIPKIAAPPIRRAVISLASGSKKWMSARGVSIRRRITQPQWRHSGCGVHRYRLSRAAGTIDALACRRRSTRGRDSYVCAEKVRGFRNGLSAKDGQIAIDQFAGWLVPNGRDRPAFSPFVGCSSWGCCATAMGRFRVLPFATACAFCTRRAPPVASLMKLVPPYSRQQMLIILDEASVDQARLGAFRRRSL